VPTLSCAVTLPINGVFERGQGNHLGWCSSEAFLLHKAQASPTPINGALGVARANTAVGVSPETFLLLLLQAAFKQLFLVIVCSSKPPKWFLFLVGGSLHCCSCCHANVSAVNSMIGLWVSNLVFCGSPIFSLLVCSVCATSAVLLCKRYLNP
jgi:hypothetical protein